MKNDKHIQAAGQTLITGKMIPSKIESNSITQSRLPAVIAMTNMRTGRVVPISSKAANMLSEKYPKEFKILKP